MTPARRTTRHWRRARARNPVESLVGDPPRRRRRCCRARGAGPMVGPQHLPRFARRLMRLRLVPTPAHGSDRLRLGCRPPISVQLVLDRPDPVLAPGLAGTRTGSLHSVLDLPRLVSISCGRVRRCLVPTDAQSADSLRVHSELAVSGGSMLDRGVHVKRLEPPNYSRGLPREHYAPTRPARNSFDTLSSRHREIRKTSARVSSSVWVQLEQCG